MSTVSRSVSRRSSMRARPTTRSQCNKAKGFAWKVIGNTSFCSGKGVSQKSYKNLKRFGKVGRLCGDVARGAPPGALTDCAMCVAAGDKQCRLPRRGRDLPARANQVKLHLGITPR